MQPGTTHHRFLFGKSFDATALAAEQKKAAVPSFSQEQLNEAREKAYAEGLAAGQAKAKSGFEESVGTILKKIEQHIDREIKVQTNHDQVASELSLQLVRKILPAYEQEFGLNEISYLIQHTLQEMAHEPRLVVRVADNMLDPVNEFVQKIAQKTAYAGKIILLAEPDMGPSDVKIEWADGGIERDVSTLVSQLDQALQAARQTLEDRPIGEAYQETKPTSSPEAQPLNV